MADRIISQSQDRKRASESGVLVLISEVNYRLCALGLLTFLWAPISYALSTLQMWTIWMIEFDWVWRLENKPRQTPGPNL
jgi:hypothetical protein